MKLQMDYLPKDNSAHLPSVSIQLTSHIKFWMCSNSMPKSILAYVDACECNHMAFIDRLVKLTYFPEQVASMIDLVGIQLVSWLNDN